MAKGRSSNYPERPVRKGRPKSSHSGGRKSKVWLSLRDRLDGDRDISAHLNFAWWKSPMYKDARLVKAKT